MLLYYAISLGRMKEPLFELIYLNVGLHACPLTPSTAAYQSDITLIKGGSSIQLSRPAGVKSMTRATGV